MRIVAFVFMLSFAVTALASPAAPKARIEREFRQLEAAVSRLMYETVLPASDVGSMNRAIYGFMRENPGVARILRTNAAGITVNDVSAESPESEASRNVSAQRWYQYVERNRAAYYSMDFDSVGAGEITLFYAWPLMTGPQRDRFAGAFAAVIDFAAQVALIDDAAPFQLAHRGKAFFQHEWDDVDHSEASLDVRGVKNLTIRTELPLPTRADPPPPRRRKVIAEEDIIPDEYDTVEASLTDIDEPADRKRSREKKEASGFSAGTIIVVILLSAAAAYMIFKFTGNPRPAPRLVREDAPPAPKASVVVRSMTEPPPPPSSVPPMPPAPPPVPPMPPPSASPLDDERMAKILLSIKEEFITMDKKIQFLAQRVNILERRR